MTQEPLSLSTALEERLEAVGLAFLARFYTVESTIHPENVDALAELGHVLTRLRRYEEGLAVDRRLVALMPDNALVHYNLACSLALVGRADEALDELEAAVDRGYDESRYMLEDDDLRSLRSEPRFIALVSRIQPSA